MSSLAVEAVLAQVAAVPTVSLPTGTEQRKRRVGECKVNIFRVTLVNRQCDSVPINCYYEFAMRPNFQLQLLASFVSSL